VPISGMHASFSFLLGDVVLSWVRLLVIHVLDEAVVGGGQQGTEEGADPVDPVVRLERSRGGGGTETSGWVQGCTGVVNACLYGQCQISPFTVCDSAVNVPASSATNKDKPIPIGAIKVSRDFSAASMRMVKTNWAVRNISKKTP